MVSVMQRMPVNMSIILATVIFFVQLSIRKEIFMEGLPIICKNTLSIRILFVIFAETEI